MDAQSTVSTSVHSVDSGKFHEKSHRDHDHHDNHHTVSFQPFLQRRWAAIRLQSVYNPHTQSGHNPEQFTNVKKLGQTVGYLPAERPLLGILNSLEAVLNSFAQMKRKGGGERSAHFVGEVPSTLGKFTQTTKVIR